jgi:hypothetical protein
MVEESLFGSFDDDIFDDDTKKAPKLQQELVEPAKQEEPLVRDLVLHLRNSIARTTDFF